MGGSGLQYHPYSMTDRPPNPNVPMRQPYLLLTNIPYGRICSSGFWYLMCRQIMYPNKKNGAGVLYGLLLPSLNQQPLSMSHKNAFNPGLNQKKNMLVPL